MIKPSKEFSKKAHIKSMQEYNKIYKDSIKNSRTPKNRY